MSTFSYHDVWQVVQKTVAEYKTQRLFPKLVNKCYNQLRLRFHVHQCSSVIYTLLPSHCLTSHPSTAEVQILVPSVTCWTGARVSHRCSGPAVKIAHHLLDVVQFGLQIFTPALLHPIIWRLQ